MDRSKRILLNDIDVQITYGNLLIKVLNINYEPPVPMRYFNTHCHSSYEFHFIPEGKGLLRIGKDHYDIGPGVLYLTGPGVYHEQISDRESPMVEFCINLELVSLEKWNDSDSSIPAQEIIELKETLMNATFWFGRDQYMTWSLVQKIIDEYQMPTIGYCRNIESLITQAVINIVRCFYGNDIVAYRQKPADINEKRRRTMDSFFRDIDKPRKAEKLAKIMSVSLRQMERLMQQYYGMTFKQKLIGTRIAVARDLLENTQLSAEEIAVKTGFSSSSHLSRAFSKYMGAPPSLFRKSLKK